MFTERAPRWGYLAQVMSHYGQMHTTLVVYPPDSRECERRLADLHRLGIPGAVIGGGLVAIGLWLLGLLPLVAVFGSVILVAALGAWIARRSRDVRRRAVVLSASASVLSANSAHDQAQNDLEELADRMRHAARQYRHGGCSHAQFLDTWRGIFLSASHGDRRELRLLRLVDEDGTDLPTADQARHARG